jgi:hypothetical protein
MERSPPSAEILLHIAEHVFLPPKLPQRAAEAELERRMNHHLTCLVADAVDDYQNLLSINPEPWAHISRMLSRIALNSDAPFEKGLLQQDLSDLNADGMCNSCWICPIAQTHIISYRHIGTSYLQTKCRSNYSQTIVNYRFRNF